MGPRQPRTTVLTEVEDAIIVRFRPSTTPTASGPRLWLSSRPAALPSASRRHDGELPPGHLRCLAQESARPRHQPASPHPGTTQPDRSEIAWLVSGAATAVYVRT